MTEDIFHDWKHSRFIVADYALLDEPGIVIVLTDLEYWIQHSDDLKAWCQQHGGQIKGMTVSLDNYEQLTFFTLRWS